MPRTKHIFIAAGILLVVIALLAYFARSSQSPMSSAATVVFTEVGNEEVSIGAEVVSGDERGARRASLVAQLADLFEGGELGSDAEPTPAPTEVDESASDESEVELSISRYLNTPTKGSIYSCGGGALVHREAGNIPTAPIMNRLNGVRIFAQSSVVGTTTTLTPVMQVPEMPFLASSPTCLVDDVVGMTLSGSIVYAGVPHRGDDARVADGLVGYALDGFGIYGPYENEILVGEGELDSCHGHMHTVMWDGVPVGAYHYHVTDTFPYTVSCFMGTPSARL